MFSSWFAKILEVKIFDFDGKAEDRDEYILDNAVRLPSSILPSSDKKQSSHTTNQYIVCLSPGKYGENQNFSKIIYPVIFDESLEKNVMLENVPILKHLSHHGNSTQFIELKKRDAKDSQLIKKITFQILSIVPECSEPLRINKETLIKSIHQFFSQISFSQYSFPFPLCLGQVLIVPYPKEIEKPQPKHALLYFPNPKTFSPKFKLKVTSINDDVNYSNEPKIYQLKKNSIITLGTSPNVKNLHLLSNVEEQKWQEEEKENKRKLQEEENNRKMSQRKKWSIHDAAISSNSTKLTKDDHEATLPEIEPLPDLVFQDLTTRAPDTRKLLSQLSFDFTRCGIGGNKEALRELVSQVFYSRALGQYNKNYGAKPIKGVLLYGPPGTGKTSIARAIASFFPQSHVKLVNGPELKSKWVGESESALRNLYADAQLAWRMHKENSPLHVIIFDEIDATFPRRGSRSGGTGVDDNMTSQMLSLMDGLANIENILIIGTTNRPELLDDALKRENRFSLMLEIGLPDMATRKEILELKTQQLRLSNLLENGIDFQYWADKTAGFSGADLEQFVRMAQNYAQTRNFDYDKETNTLKIKECVIEKEILEAVTITDFERSYLNSKPLHRVDRAEFNFNRENFVIYDSGIQSIVDNFQSCVKQLTLHPSSNRTSFLLTGKTGTGKTDIAKYLAEISKFDYIKLIVPENFLGKSIQVQLEILDDYFRQALRVDKSIIILDNLEGILSASGDVLRKENAMVLKLISLMNGNQQHNKCMVIATAQDAKALNNIRLSSYFDEKLHLSALCLSYTDSASLELIARPLNIRFLSNPNKEPSLSVTLTIKQILYYIKKLVNHENVVDKDSFFKLAMNACEDKKVTVDKENNEMSNLFYTSVFSTQKNR